MSRPTRSVLEQPQELPPRSLLHGFGVSFFAALHDTDSGRRPFIGLVELARLSITESNPVAYRVPVRKISAGNTLLPLSGQER